MIRPASEVLAVLALLLLRRGAGGAVTPAPAPRETSGREVPLVRTGEPDLVTWGRRRLALLVAALGGLEPPIRGELADKVALSLLAQYAHETDAGKAEFNFNLGGWTARRGDTFHTATDRLSSSAGFRWTAYPDLPTAIEDQLSRLIRGFPSSWGLLLADPENDGWIRELGRRGYYTADPNDYSAAWAARRRALGKALP